VPNADGTRALATRAAIAAVNDDSVAARAAHNVTVPATAINAIATICGRRNRPQIELVQTKVIGKIIFVRVAAPHTHMYAPVQKARCGRGPDRDRLSEICS
jgi:hypothetical protein